MFQITIQKQGKITNQAKFETESEANEWLEKEVANKSFGEPEHEINTSEFGEEPVMVVVPSEYEVVGPVDISEQIEQARANVEALAYLASTDWYVIRAIDSGVPVPEEIKIKRAEARIKI